PERIVLLDDPTSDVERGGGQPREAQVPPQLRRGGLRGFGRLTVAGHLHHRFERRLQQHRRRSHGTASSACAAASASVSSSTFVPCPHHRHVTSSTTSDSSSSSSTVSAP